MEPPRAYKRAEFDLLLNQESSTHSSIRCLPDLILHNAVHNPGHLFCIHTAQSPEGSHTQFDFTGVTFAELARAVEGCCAWILANVPGVHAAEVGKDGSVRKSRPLALFMESDLGLFIYLVASLTLNIPCLLLSIRLNQNAIHHLIGEVDAASIIVSPRTRPMIECLEDDAGRLEASVIVAASLEDISPASCSMSSEANPLTRIHSCRSLVRENDRGVLILHSSGTTGLPKAIYLAHRYLLGYAACHLFPIDEDVSNQGWNLSTLPLFHGFGALAPCLALSIGKPVCMPPSSTIPTGDLVASLLKNRDITSLMTVPTILEDISHMVQFEPIACDLAKLDFVVVGGGGIKMSVGQTLQSRNVKLLNHFGATELGALAPIFRPDKSYDWAYLRVRTDLALKLIPSDCEGGSPQGCKLIGYPFAWDSEFELQDRLEFNPLKPGSEVRILGRNDDVIVLATGEKVLPHRLEQKLEQHPLIRRAVVFGNGQFEIGVLIEPFSTTTDCSDGFIDTIWPKVVEGNNLMDSHAQVSTKGAVLVKPTDKDIPLSDKGSPQRQEVYSVFESEIDDVYAKLALGDANGAAVSFDLENIEQSLRNVVQECLPLHLKPGTWGDEADFIHLGMNSLQATRLRRLLTASLSQSQHQLYSRQDLPPDYIYSHPSISKLAEALGGSASNSISQSSATETMKRLATKHAIRHDDFSSAHEESVVLLTGSSGSLGSHLLQQLCHNPEVRRVICMVRLGSHTSTARSRDELEARQQKAFQDRGILLSKHAWSKIEFVTWQVGADVLGLSKDVYRELSSRITHIFHGAWPMDFKVKLPSFEPQIKTVRDLIELGRAAHKNRPCIKPRVVLASSIAAVGGYSSKTKSVMVPEIIMDEPGHALPIGYAEAKWVCEKVMQSAHDFCKDEVEPIIVRIGQLSGSQVMGCWSSKEHIPALIHASQIIGAMPDIPGTCSWIPVDQAVQVVSDVLLGRGKRDLVYHLENPIRQPWADVCSVIECHLSLPSSQRLPFKEWLGQVLAARENPPELIDFLENHFLLVSTGCLVLDTARTRKVSRNLRSTNAIETGTIELYLEFWKSIGLLKSSV